MLAPKPVKPDGAVALLTKVLKEQGFKGWYQVRIEALNATFLEIYGLRQGMGAQITKAVLCQALLFVSKDQFEQYALMIMSAHRKLINN